MTDFLQSNFDLIQEKNKEIYDNTPEYVHGVSYSKKESNGITTDEECIKYYVDKKLPIDQIPESERIPKFLEINGKQIKTDVVESPATTILPLCNDYTTPGANVAPHRDKHRPLKGGISLINGQMCIVLDSNPNDIFHITVGTLGGFVVDNKTNTVVGLTNNHVAIMDATYGHLRNPAGQIYNIVQPRNLRYFQFNGTQFVENGVTSGVYPQAMVQFKEGTFSTYSGAKIGRPKKYEPIYLNDVNYIDAALFTVDQNMIQTGISNRQLGLESFTANMPFASTAEINGSLGKPIMSAGRTTGPKAESCGIVISSVGVSVQVNGYNFQGASVAADFADCLGIKYSDGTQNAIVGGDSGSIVAAKFNEVWKIIGLVFAGWAGEGYVCRIDRIVQALDIAPWNTQPITLDTVNPTTILKPMTETRKVIEEAGVRYWQGGIFSEGGPPPPPPPGEPPPPPPGPPGPPGPPPPPPPPPPPGPSSSTGGGNGNGPDWAKVTLTAEDFSFQNGAPGDANWCYPNDGRSPQTETMVIFLTATLSNTNDDCGVGGSPACGPYAVTIRDGGGKIVAQGTVAPGGELVGQDGPTVIADCGTRSLTYTATASVYGSLGAGSDSSDSATVDVPKGCWCSSSSSSSRSSSSSSGRSSSSTSASVGFDADLFDTLMSDLQNDL